MTGRLARSPRPRVKTLSVRQSSLSGTVSRAPPRPANSGRCLSSGGNCGACPAHASALRTPAHGAGLRGGMKRELPPGGAPYGTPLNALAPSAAVPRIFPLVVSTTGASPASAWAVRGHAASMAALAVAPARNVRRSVCVGTFAHRGAAIRTEIAQRHGFLRSLFGLAHYRPFQALNRAPPRRAGTFPRP